MNILFGPDKEVVSIELSGSMLRVAYLKFKGKRKIVCDLSINDISSLKDNDIGGILKSFLNNNKVKNPKVILVIPSNSVITKNIEVPSQDSNEIEDIGIVYIYMGARYFFMDEEFVIEELVERKRK